MNTKRILFGSFVLLVALFVGFLFRLLPTEPEQGLTNVTANQNPSDLSITSDTEMEVSRFPLTTTPTFLDVVTGGKISASLVNWSVDLEPSTMKVAPSKVAARDLAAGIGYWTFVEDDQSFSFSVKDTYARASEYHLPIFARLTVRIFDSSTGNPIDGVSCQVGDLDQSKYLECVGFGDVGFEVAFSPLGTPAYFRRIYELTNGPIDWIDCLPQDGAEKEGTFNTTHLGSGLLGIRAHHQDFGQRFSVVEVVAGLTNEIEIPLDSRPRLLGVLRDAKGIAMPNRRIDVLVDLGPYADDMGESDGGFAVVVAGSPGDWHRGARLPIRTGKYGEFEMVMPKGIQYAAEYSGQSSYGFQVSEEIAIPSPGDIFIEVIAVDYSEGYEVQLIREDGGSVEGMHVRPRLADDFPWFRQFPGVAVDENGIARLPMLSEGQDKVRLIVQTGFDWTSSDVLVKSRLLQLPRPPFKLSIPTVEE